jgi:hypothetical protein
MKENKKSDFSPTKKIENFSHEQFSCFRLRNFEKVENFFWTFSRIEKLDNELWNLSKTKQKKMWEETISEAQNQN